MRSNDTETYLKIQEGADRVNVCYNTMKNWIDDPRKGIKVFQEGRIVRIVQSSLDDYMERRTTRGQMK